MPVHLTDFCDRAMTVDVTDSPARISGAPLCFADNSAMRQAGDMGGSQRARNRRTRMRYRGNEIRRAFARRLFLRSQERRLSKICENDGSARGRGRR